MRLLVCIAIAAASLFGSTSAAAQDAAQACWCHAWVHGADHGTDCFMTDAGCETARTRRGPSGESRSCERVEQETACERTGWIHGARVNLGPTRPAAATLLGRSLSQLRRELGAPTSRDSGWHRFGPHIAIKMTNARSERVIVRVATGLDCMEAANREGFADAMGPIHRGQACDWPGTSPRHRLDPQGRMAGRLDLSTGMLEIWLRD